MNINSKEWQLHQAKMLVQAREFDLRLKTKIDDKVYKEWAQENLNKAIEGLREEIIKVYYHGNQKEM